MPEVKQYVYTHKEIAELLIKDQGIHEGLWGAYYEFSFTAANAVFAPSIDTPQYDKLKNATIIIAAAIAILLFMITFLSMRILRFF